MTDHYHPDRSEWKTVWLGNPDNAEHATAGWLPVEAEVRTSQLAVFERKVTIGDATKDSDDYISSWISSDFTGGLGILNLNEGTDTNKFYWGIVESRYVNQLALPPLVSSIPKPSGASGRCYPLGDVYDVDGVGERGTLSVQTFYAAWGTTGAYKVYGYNEGGSTWYSAAGTDLTARPLEKGTPFVGYASNGYASLFVPMGASGYATITETTAGTPTVTNVAAAAATSVDSTDGKPAAVSFCVFTDRLWALDTDGALWKTADGSVWTLVQAPTETSTSVLKMRFDRSQTPRKLVSYLNRNGEPTLCLVTDQGLWMFEELDVQSGRWQQTAVQYPPHPDFGLGAAVWRPGEDLHIASGMDTVRFTSANVIVPLSGPSSGDGVPLAYLGKIVDLEPELSCLYALVDGSTANALLAWTGTGWHALWEGGGTPTRLTVSKAPSGYRLWWGMEDGTIYAMRLRRTFHNPRSGQNPNDGSGLDEYATSGYLETGRFDAQMTGFDRIVSHVVVDMDFADANHTMTIRYQTDRTQQAGLTWQTLGTVNASGVSSFPFNPDGDDFNEGVPFNWIQFQLTFARSGNEKISPVLRSMSMMFVKIPQNTQSFVFTVPLPKRTWMGRTAGEIDDHLVSLLTTPSFVQLVHQDQSYRGKVAGLSGADATGDDYSGGRTVNFIAIPEGP